MMTETTHRRGVRRLCTAAVVTAAVVAFPATVVTAGAIHVTSVVAGSDRPARQLAEFPGVPPPPVPPNGCDTDTCDGDNSQDNSGCTDPVPDYTETDCDNHDATGGGPSASDASTSLPGIVVAIPS